MIFSRLYNAFVCSRKTEGAESSNHDVELPEENTLNVWFSAVENSDIPTVQDYLHKGFHVNALNKKSWSALHTSVWNGYTELCSLLLKHGADPDADGPGGITALCLASQLGHIGPARDLLHKHCNVNKQVDIDNNQGVTALHLAARNGHEEIVKLLIAAGANISATMTSDGIAGLTALHLAVEGGHMNIIDLLLGAGSDVNSSTMSCNEVTC